MLIGFWAALTFDRFDCALATLTESLLQLLLRGRATVAACHDTGGQSGTVRVQFFRHLIVVC